MFRRRVAFPDLRARPSRLIAGLAVAATSIAGASGLAGTAAAAPPDRDVSSQLAEAQFRVYLLTHTDLRPTDVICTPPPTQDAAGEMLCFALIEGRETVAALATLDCPGAYSFTAITKSEQTAPTAPTAPTSAAPPDTQSVADPDQAVLDSMSEAITSEAESTTQVLLDYNEVLTSVDSYTFDQATSTLQVRATSTATAADRDALAWSITDTMAYLWESGSPLRAETATIQPRLEVILDDDIFGTPFAVMLQIADYEISFDEWLAVTTGSTAYATPPAARASRDEDVTTDTARVGDHQDRRGGQTRAVESHHPVAGPLTLLA